MQEHKECYGTMFHDSLHFDVNEKMKGKVFDFEQDALGLGISDRKVSVKIGEWDDCRVCEEFEHCYKLCTAKLLLETAMR